MTHQVAATPDLFVKTLLSSVERAAGAQLKRHAKAGSAITRERALSMAIEQHQQKLIQMGEKLENEGSEGSADVFREMADLLPNAMRELGLR